MYYLEELALMGQLDTGRIGRIDGSARTSWATPESFPRRSLARSPQPRDPVYTVCTLHPRRCAELSWVIGP